VKLIVGDPANALALASIAGKAAVWPGFRIAGQRLAAVARIQVNVATERPAVACVFDQERFTINPKTNDGPDYGKPINLQKESCVAELTFMLITSEKLPYQANDCDCGSPRRTIHCHLEFQASIHDLGWKLV
jgi:hypothetical protein